MSEVANMAHTYQWLNNSNIRANTKALIMAGQEQALNTRTVVGLTVVGWVIVSAGSIIICVFTSNFYCLPLRLVIFTFWSTQLSYWWRWCVQVSSSWPVALTLLLETYSTLVNKIQDVLFTRFLSGANVSVVIRWKLIVFVWSCPVYPSVLPPSH